METVQVRLLLMDKPGKSTLDSIRNRAAIPLEVGAISALPEFMVEQTKPTNLWHVVLTVPKSDKGFWLGFYEGMVFCINNRQITVGCTE